MRCKDEQEILTLISCGNPDGLKSLFDLYYKPLCIFAMNFLDSFGESEDIVQDLFVKFWEKYKDKQFLKDRFRGKEYLMRSFFAGSSPENNYTPSMPYRVVVSENPYSRSQLAEGYLTLYVNCSGADSPRPLKLRKKPSTGQWFLWEQQLLAGIRIPAAADPWS